MVIKCLECNHKCGAPFNLVFHYSICHEDKIAKCMCGDKTLSGICIKTDCSFKDEFGYSPSPNSSSNLSIDPSPDSSSNPSPNPNPSTNSSSNPSPNPSIDPSPIPSSNPSPNPSSNPKVITRCCNKCNYVKPLTDFDKSKYTCGKCTSAKVSCLYCPSIVRYDRMNAHVKRQHPDVDLPKGFTRNLRSSYTDLPNNGVRASKTEGLYTDPQSGYTNPIFTLNGESCSCKYNFVSFLINNGINIEKVKENINLLKSIDSFKE